MPIKALGRLAMLRIGSTDYDTSRQKAVAVAQAVLDRKTGICAGSCAVASLAHDLVPDWCADPDFVVLGALSADSDRFPLATARAHWVPSALAELDREREEIERRAEADVMTACQSILDRFGSGPTSR